MGSGCWLFWPAAHADMYSFFVAAQFVIGCGLSFLETGANSFIAQLGPTASSEPPPELFSGVQSLGSITAGLVGTVFIFSGVEFSGAETAAKRAAGTMQGLSSLGNHARCPHLPGAGHAGAAVGIDGVDHKVSRHNKEDVSREDAGRRKTFRCFSAILCWLWWRSFFTLRAGGHMELLHSLRPVGNRDWR